MCLAAQWSADLPRRPADAGHSATTTAVNDSLNETVTIGYYRTTYDQQA